VENLVDILAGGGLLAIIGGVASKLRRIIKVTKAGVDLYSTISEMVCYTEKAAERGLDKHEAELAWQAARRAKEEVSDLMKRAKSVF